MSSLIFLSEKHSAISCGLGCYNYTHLNSTAISLNAVSCMTSAQLHS